jgi:ElaB/YqjD/DUF883 family membrane-anchored ribosome-binding protein
MPEPLTRTPDFPNFDTYPGGRPTGRASLPPADGEAERERRLNGAAESVGNWVGKAVNRARELPERLESVRDRFTVVAGRQRDAAAGRASEWKDRAQRRGDELRQSAEQQLLRARLRAEQVTREYPLQVIAACAALGIVAGITLRLWRSRD